MLGCGSSEESRQDMVDTTGVGIWRAPGVKFETKTDTVNSVHRSGWSEAGTGEHEGQVRFMVQVGAFKDPQNASRLQELTRARYGVPVVNDFNIQYGLYQIRIGFFETWDEADAFRRRLRSEHKNDYSDCWIVQLKTR